VVVSVDPAGLGSARETKPDLETPNMVKGAPGDTVAISTSERVGLAVSVAVTEGAGATRRK
jgi:hypothetical protein